MKNAKVDGMRRKKRRAKGKKDASFRARRIVLVLLCAVVVVGIAQGRLPGGRVSHMGKNTVPDWVDVQLLPVDGHSRSGSRLKDLNDIVIHYVGNPGSTGQANRDYFAGSKSNVSSHFVVGLDGEVIQCIPLDEYSAASNHRNGDTISIEVCHPDDTGRFNQASYESLVRLTAWLCREAKLDEEHVIRHYDVTGKICPKYFVEHEDAWEQFLDDVKKEI